MLSLWRAFSLVLVLVRQDRAQVYQHWLEVSPKKADCVLS